MSETLRTLSFEVLKAKHDLSSLSNTEIYQAYREIYTELKKADRAYVQSNPGMAILK